MAERWLLVAPLFHAAAVNIVVFQIVYAGGYLYVQEDFHPTEAIRALSKERTGGALLAPAMLQAGLLVPTSPSAAMLCWGIPA
jgi:acyl-CoA synthetase (AMP-forming)/AMP-acid ligase II